MERVTMDLHLLDAVPPELFTTSVENLGDVLPGPTLLRLPGRTDPPLFISTLLHGDEPTGFQAMQKLLAHYLSTDEGLPRSVWLFLGNVHAAKGNLRHLDQQPDFNRIWNGGDQPEHRLADRVVEMARENGLFACIDIHNTSGKNPPYSAINKLDPACVFLGKLFSDKLVYFTRPDTVLSKAFAGICPAVTVECGQAGDPKGLERVHGFVDQCLNLTAIVPTGYRTADESVYHSIGRIEFPDGCTVGFDHARGNEDFVFVEDLDSLNFQELPENTRIGWRHDASKRLQVIDETGKEVGDEFFVYKGNEIRLKRAVVPSMLTTSPYAALDDCLGYLMQRYVLE
ncbi:M14 family metallopeptidase [Nitrospina gracilis]|uniref:M14 family metallopeptidase n=1 Tax=Nitrospina gracilis TaxID=35801 RepID=UPI001F275C10|nr:hypothetical protein [Nitrospina gracilis Nb-211]